MELKWKYAEATRQPEVIEVRQGYVYLRKDIKKVLRDEGEVEISVIWTFYQVRLTEEEYQKYLECVEVEQVLVELEKMRTDHRLYINTLHDMMSCILEMSERCSYTNTDDMVKTSKVWYNALISGEKTYEQVPSQFKEYVHSLLIENLRYDLIPDYNNETESEE